MRYRDIKKYDRIYVIFRTLQIFGGANSDPDNWECGVWEYVKDEKSGVFRSPVLKDFTFDKSNGTYDYTFNTKESSCRRVLDLYGGPMSKEEVKLRISASGLSPVFLFDETKSDMRNEAYLIVPAALLSRELRRLKEFFEKA